MIKISLQISSQTLYRPVTVSIGLPYSLTTSDGPFKVLYALHPAMENGDFFFDKLGLSPRVDSEQVAIVAPNLGNSYFINTPYESQSDFLQTELMPLLCEILPLSSKREDNLLLGISMGAFGAAHWALSCPERFLRVALLSGVFFPSLPIDPRAKKSRELRPLVKIFNEKAMPRLMKDSKGNILREADIRPLFSLVQLSPDQPNFALWHGESDYLSINQSGYFDYQCRTYGIDSEINIAPGVHDLSYWLRTIEQVLCWLLHGGV